MILVKKRMKETLLILACGLISGLGCAQLSNEIRTEKIWRVNFLNPAVELEVPTGMYSSFSAALGVGYGGGFPGLTLHNGDGGFIYIISPFGELQQKWYYNLNKRHSKGRNTVNNSGNFVSIRFISRGHSIAENVIRSSNFDFAIGPTWGIQRKWGKNFHFLFDIGAQYYFDTKGHGNFFPIIVQLNIGLDLKKN